MFSALKRFYNGKPAFEVPPPDAMQQEFDVTQFTPDVWWLEHFAFHYVLIYDQHMSTHGHRGLEGINMGMGYTQKKYTMYKKDLGPESYPIVLRSRVRVDNPPWANPIPGNPESIKGELWLMTTDQVISLDNAYENGQAWLRKRITVLVPDRKKRVFDNKQAAYPMQDSPDMKPIRAYIYLGNPDVWQPMIQADKPRLISLATMYKPNSPKPEVDYYYYFSPNELNDE